MRYFLLVIILTTLSFNSYSQIEKHTTQVGISALPVFDVLNVYPDNKIGGYGILGNFGYFPIKNLGVGMNPFYAYVSNSYNPNNGGGNQPQIFIRHVDKISLYGLNAYLRYYLVAKEKFSLYPMLSLGIGNLQTKTFNEANDVQINNKSNAVFNLLAGVGINYHVAKKVALELSIPYLYLKYLTPVPTRYHGIAPTIGVQFYLSSNTNSLAK